MRLKRNNWLGRPVRFSVEDAAETSCYEHDGEISAEGVAKAYGRLVAVLHENGKLKNDDVIRVLGYSFEEVSEKDELKDHGKIG